jgi:hypothetical protein
VDSVWAQSGARATRHARNRRNHLQLSRRCCTESCLRYENPEDSIRGAPLLGGKARFIMKTPQLAAFLSLLAAATGAAVLLGCTSVNPVKSHNGQAGSSAVESPYEQIGGLCHGVQPEKLPPVAQWIDDFESSGDRHRLRDNIDWWCATDQTWRKDGEDYQVQVTTGGPNSAELSDASDSYNKDKSKTALHMVAKITDDEKNPRQIDGDHWGVNWQYEVPGGDGTVKNRWTTAFDFSEYDGMIMWVRRGDTSASSSFTVQFPTPWSMPATADKGGDGTCLDEKAEKGADAGTGVNGKCYAHMTYSGTAIDCWRPVRIVFKAGPDFNLAPAFNPGPDGFDAAQAYGLEIAFASSTEGNYSKYWPIDLWVDDMYLYKESNSGSN